MKFTKLLPLLLPAFCSLHATPLQKGPYTLYELDEQVYRIEDSNEINPPGIVWGEDGKPVSFNNCSDMYLILGADTALLIDLSNEVKWDPTAKESLRELVDQQVGARQLAITFTHNHGDHVGMLSAYVDDHDVEFWINEAEFPEEGKFPSDRTTHIGGQGSLDLGGGTQVNYFEMPGHTAHSTVFFVEGKNMMISGDAIGSGDDVWLFDAESFPAFEKSVDRLIQYLGDSENRIDQQQLAIYGGHFWQKGPLDTLKVNYVYDMKALIKKIKEGEAEVRDLKTFLPFLNGSFKYQSAGIAWNKEAAARYQTEASKN